ncbi:MAG: hypothetical protein ACKPFF_21975 [Planktothrix sp.]
MASTITLQVSFTSLVGGKSTEGLTLLHQQGLLTEEILKACASFLGASRMESLDYFIQEAFPGYEELASTEANKGNYSGDEDALPELEGYLEYDGSLKWWLGVVPPAILIEALKLEYYPIQVLEGGTFSTLQPEVMFDYLEVLEALKGMVESYDQPRVEEEIEGVITALDELTDSDLKPRDYTWWRPCKP